jgi:hypothetical protein
VSAFLPALWGMFSSCITRKVFLRRWVTSINLLTISVSDFTQINGKLEVNIKVHEVEVAVIWWQA